MPEKWYIYLLYIIIALLAAASWHLGVIMGVRREEKRSADEIEEYHEKYKQILTKYEVLVDRYVQLKETMTEGVKK